jgi:hypothetical protein
MTGNSFSPKALNDSDVVVGTSSSGCQVWQSGTLTTVESGAFCAGDR